MGYLRPVSQYNIGKKSEFYSRKYFDVHKAMNSKFIKDFGTPEGDAPEQAWLVSADSTAWTEAL